MTDTVEPRLAEFTLREALLPDGRRLVDATVRITARLAGASTPGSDLYEAVLIHNDADGKPSQGIPQVVCKLVPANPDPRSDIPAGLGLREELAYQKIRATSTRIPMPLAHLIGYKKNDQEYLFILERYDVNALKKIQSLKPDQRAAYVQRFFAAGYLALRHLNQRVQISMRDAHPKNFVFRESTAGEPGFEFVAVDFGHASVEEVHTLERPLRAMSIIQHPQVLASNGLHHGLQDDLFSLAVSSYVLLSSDFSTPWVDKSDQPIPFESEKGRQDIYYGMPDAADRLKPQWEVFAGGANADFLKMLAELLEPERSREERRKYVAEELPAIVKRLEPWTAQSIADMEQTAAAGGLGTDPGAATVPNPPISATIPLASRQQSTGDVRAPHGIRYLAELEDFRPPPPAPAPSPEIVAEEQRIAAQQQHMAAQQQRMAAAQRQRRATGKVVHHFLVQAVPFLVLATLLAFIKFVPGLGLDALRDAQILPRAWEMPTNILLLLAAAGGSVGLLMSSSSGENTLPSAINKGILAGFLSGLALVVAPTAAVVAAESLLYVMPGTTWRYEDWSFWPQWLLVIGFLAAAALGVFAILDDDWRGKLLIGSTACLAGALLSTLISSAGPYAWPDQYAIQADCGPSTYEFTHATQSVCIPVSQDWDQLPTYATDPFVVRGNLPQPAALGSGPNRAAVGLSSTQFPCLSAFVLRYRANANSSLKIAVPQLPTDPNSEVIEPSAKGSEGRVNRLRLGGGSYNVYKNITDKEGTVSGTTVYSAISSRVPFVNPEDFLSSGQQGTTVYQVQRDCPAGDQSRIDQSVEKLVSSVKFNERFRLDVTELHFTPAVLAAKNLDASRIEVPVPSGTSVASYTPDQHPELLANGVIAAGGVVLTSNNDFEKTTFANVFISDLAPEAYASATPSSIDPAWSSTTLQGSDNGYSQNYYQKQSVGGTDYYVAVTLMVRDLAAYDDRAKQKFKQVLTGIHVQNGAIDVIKGLSS